MWFDRVLAGAGVFKEVAWGLACPFHCGPSGLPYLGLGLAVGLILGISLSLCVCIYLLQLQVLSTPPSTSFFPASDLAANPKVRSRLRGYIRE